MEIISFGADKCPRCKSTEVSIKGYEESTDNYVCSECNCHWRVSKSPLVRVMRNYSKLINKYKPKY